MKTDLERFEEKFDLVESGCWIWNAGRTSRYGSFHLPSYPYERKMVAAHKASLFLYKGKATSEKETVMHSCDNGFCVNPDHLSVGTHSDNMKDMFAKGRDNHPRKLSIVNTIVARQMRRSGLQVKEIAEYFDISSSQMSRVTSGVLKKWRKIV